MRTSADAPCSTLIRPMHMQPGSIVRIVSSSTRRIEGRRRVARPLGHRPLPMTLNVMLIACGMVPMPVMAPKGAGAASADAGGASCAAKPPLSPLEAIRRGRDLQYLRSGSLATLSPAAQTSLDGVLCDEQQRRCLLITEKDHIARLLPPAITRDRDNPLLLEWSFLRMLPPDWYAIVFETSTGRYRAMPESKLRLDGYPPVSRSAADPERAAGYTDYRKLRLVLYPPGWRFFMLGMHAPLMEPGVWPSAAQVQYTGYRLVHAPRAQKRLSGMLMTECPREKLDEGMDIEGNIIVRQIDEVYWVAADGAFDDRHWRAIVTDAAVACTCFTAALQLRYHLFATVLGRVGTWAGCVSHHRLVDPLTDHHRDYGRFIEYPAQWLEHREGDPGWAATRELWQRWGTQEELDAVSVWIQSA